MALIVVASLVVKPKPPAKAQNSQASTPTDLMAAHTLD
jgi:hypothetical protein